MARRRHPDQDIEAALRHAESHGWSIVVGGSHAWGRMKCPCNDGHCGSREHCITSIWSTPRVPIHHARQLRRIADRCAAARPTEPREEDGDEGA
jgi:hypothetical protein